MERHLLSQDLADQYQQIPVPVEPEGVVLSEQVAGMDLISEATVAKPAVMGLVVAEVQVMLHLQVPEMVVMAVILLPAQQGQEVSLEVPAEDIGIVMATVMLVLLPVEGAAAVIRLF
jgi:hypothetical protein